MDIENLIKAQERAAEQLQAWIEEQEKAVAEEIKAKIFNCVCCGKAIANHTHGGVDTSLCWTCVKELKSARKSATPFITYDDVAIIEKHKAEKAKAI